MSTPEPAATSSTAATVKNRGSDYVILEWEAAGNAWKQRGSVVARSVEQAIRKHVAEKAPAGGEFVAIPARSFAPVTVAVEQTTRIRLT